MRVLVVEDDEVLREAVEAGLALAGFTVDAVDNLHDAKAAATDWSYDAMAFADHSEVELERLQAERQLEKKRLSS